MQVEKSNEVERNIHMDLKKITEEQTSQTGLTEQISENRANGTREKGIGAKGDFKPLIVAFCCNWCSYAGADLAGTSRLSYPAEVKIIRVPCSCRINPIFILRAFGRGADGVIICGCHPGDCHYSTGNYYTRRRMTLLFSMLDYLGIEKERTRVEWVSAAEGVKFSTVMNDFAKTIHRLGENKKLEDLRCKEFPY